MISCESFRSRHRICTCAWLETQLGSPSLEATHGWSLFLVFCLSCFFVFFTCNSHTLPKKKSIGISHIVLQQQYNMWLTLLMLNSLSFKFLRAFVTLYLKCRSLEQPLKEMLFIGSRFVICYGVALPTLTIVAYAGEKFLFCLQSSNVVDTYVLRL